MDIADVSKVACRKRISDDVEKLREKVSRENKKIIKLKVAQDTAYWDLKEKLRQVETNHEKLQQNMLEVQMQYETVSGQYQEELRHRPEILNKLGSSREICNVLVEYSERLRETLSRCKADQAALCDTYQQSSELVRDMKAQQLQNDEKNKQIMENLQDKLKMTTEHKGQLVELLTAEKQRVDVELGAVRTELAAAVAGKEQLAATYADCTRQLEQCRQELGKKEEALISLQNDIKQLLYEFNAEASEMKNKLVKLEKDLKDATASNEALKNALSNQENYTKSVCEQNNQLLEKIASLEEEKTSICNVVKDLEDQIKGWTQTNDIMKKQLEDMSEKNKNLEIECGEKVQNLMDVETEKQGLLATITRLETESEEMKAALAKATEVTRSLNVKLEQIGMASAEQEKLIDDINAALNKSRDEAKAKMTELSDIIESKNQELDSKASTISHLMNEVKTAVEARAKLELVLDKTKTDLEKEKQAANEHEKKIEKLEVVVRSKDEDLSKHMNIIMELRSDKERLQDRIQSMQNKIDNIQKELTGQPPSRPSRMEPELDDNAVMLTVSRKKDNMSQMKQPEAPAPRRDPNNDLFSFLSDSSVDADATIDANEVNRRFKALSRGERLSPMPLSSLKRRSEVPVQHGGLLPKNTDKDEEMISLSQVKQSMKSKQRTIFKHKQQQQHKAKKNNN